MIFSFYIKKKINDTRNLDYILNFNPNDFLCQLVNLFLAQLDDCTYKNGESDP